LNSESEPAELATVVELAVASGVGRFDAVHLVSAAFRAGRAARQEAISGKFVGIGSAQSETPAPPAKRRAPAWPAEGWDWDERSKRKPARRDRRPA